MRVRLDMWWHAFITHHSGSHAMYAAYACPEGKPVPHTDLVVVRCWCGRQWTVYGG